MHSADQAFTHVFADVHLEFGIGLVDDGQGLRQEEGSDGRDETDSHWEVESFVAGMGLFDQLLCIKIDFLGTAQQFFADGGDNDLFVIAFKDDNAEVLFHFGNTKRKRGLGDVAFLGSAFEMLVAGDGEGELDLAESNHLMFT
ncbi:hypothetical protein HMPREF9080_00103 [Cardiobacterium valvarum F0432]|uniref:Uncharacterized protein n=1 Tax=Cardiobacterium valvarum F0432 TaxID=797473 RepID=G9ZBI0_9GAMM|nr:hypothetical protein HMPREF9080_00103 [Cardiobacterium valvarum F0432]